MSQNQSNIIPFIPAQESAGFIFFFRQYVKWLFKRRFHRIWIHQEYKPLPDDKTVYFLNHSSWWDGLIPFLLNEFLFHQNGRAMMEDKQMINYGFFKKIGAFSVNRDDKRKALRSLRYALESLKRNNASLFIYPQGKIVPEHYTNLEFENGIGWLHNKCPDCQFVPVSLTMHTMRSDKPELFINISKQVELDTGLSVQERTKQLQHILQSDLESLWILSSIDNPEQHFKVFL